MTTVEVLKAMKRLRKRLAHKLRIWADLMDHHGAPKLMSGITFTFERGEGLVIHYADRMARVKLDPEPYRKGCPMWYYGGEDYEKAHLEARNPV